MKGKVEEISQESSKSGVEYLRVKIDDEMYSVRNQDHFDIFQEGDVVEFDYRESGQWKNIIDLAVLNSVGDETKERVNYLLLRDRQIARMSCLKSAS